MPSSTKFPTAVSTQDPGEPNRAFWNAGSIGFITAEDGAEATVTGNGFFSDWLVGKSHGFALPSSAIVRGVQLAVKARITVPSGGDVAHTSLCLGTTGVINSASAKLDVLNVGLGPAAWYTFGSPTDLWGLALTPALVNGAGFCAAVEYAHLSAPAAITVYVDALKVTVHYDLPPTYGMFMEA